MRNLIRNITLAAFMVGYVWIAYAFSGKSPVPPVTAPPSSGRQVLDKGWSKDYTAYIQANATPEMLNFPAPSFCPKWTTLTASDKKDFWAAILESTAYPESGFDRFNRYIEHGIPGVDPVTGITTESDGLLQMSYGDSACRGLFSYAADKAKPVKQWSIFDPYLNLQCGINVWTQLIKKYGTSPSLRSVGGHYWSTIRDGKVDPYFKKRFTKCF